MNTTAIDRYPALMAYVVERNKLIGAAAWCGRLNTDKAEAIDGAFADVATDMHRAETDYAAQQRAKKQTEYPYNSAMGEFLGLPLKANNEPEHGYYMARCVSTSWRLGQAQREAAELIAAGKELKITLAKDKRGKPIRFARFVGAEQIKIEGSTVALANGKRRGRLSSNWSEDSCMLQVVAALRSGLAYGQATS